MSEKEDPGKWLVAGENSGIRKFFGFLLGAKFAKNSKGGISLHPFPTSFPPPPDLQIPLPMAPVSTNITPEILVPFFRSSSVFLLLRSSKARHSPLRLYLFQGTRRSKGPDCRASNNCSSSPSIFTEGRTPYPYSTFKGVLDTDRMSLLRTFKQKFWLWKKKISLRVEE